MIAVGVGVVNGRGDQAIGDLVEGTASALTGLTLLPGPSRQHPAVLAVADPAGGQIGTGVDERQLPVQPRHKRRVPRARVLGGGTLARHADSGELIRAQNAQHPVHLRHRRHTPRVGDPQRHGEHCVEGVAALWGPATGSACLTTGRIEDGPDVGAADQCRTLGKSVVSGVVGGITAGDHRRPSAIRRAARSSMSTAGRCSARSPMARTPVVPVIARNPVIVMCG